MLIFKEVIAGAAGETITQPVTVPGLGTGTAIFVLPQAAQAADSEEVAWAIRDDVARDYEMMSPGFGARWHGYFWQRPAASQA